MAYIDTPLSTMPENVDNFPRRQDLTIEDVVLANQYETKYNAGDIAGANLIIQNNPQLKVKIMNAEAWNELRDAIIATQTLLSKDIESYIMNIAKYQGTFDPTKAYKKYDLVDYVHEDAINSYWVKYSNTPIGTLPTDTSWFAPQTLRGLQGVSGIGLSFKGVWTELTTYAVDESVSYNGEIYQCKQAGSGQIPNTTNETAYWKKIMYINPQIITSTEQPINTQNNSFWFKIIKTVQ